MIADARMARRTNMTSEFCFAINDNVEKNLKNASVTTSGGLATSIVNNSFQIDKIRTPLREDVVESSSSLESQWGLEVVQNAVDFVMIPANRLVNEEQDREDMSNFQAEGHRRKQKKEAAEMQKAIRKQVEASSYRCMRRIKSVEELRRVVKTIPEKRLYDWLKFQLNAITIGFGCTEWYVPWSKNKILRPTTELYEQFVRLLQNIKANPDILTEPVVSLRRSVEDLSVFGEVTDDVKKIHSNLTSILNDVMEDLNGVYGVRLLEEWSNVQPVIWGEALTEFQRKFKRGAKFIDDGIHFVVAGLQWDERAGDYICFYHPVSKTPKMIEHYTVEHTAFKTVILSTKTNVGFNDIDMQWV
jgi:hypothetical protein